MSDKLLEVAALIAGGVALYMVVENNLPQIKKAISNIQPSISHIISTQPSLYQPVSTTTVSPWEPIPHKKGMCPPGMYEDYTDGILRCHSAHGTRELDPHVKKMIPDQQWAYGKVVDNNYWGYSTPNMTQPLVPPVINKEIESQIKKHHQKEVKHQKKDPLVEERYPSKIKKEYDPHKRKLVEIPSHDDDQVSVQMECPHDLSTLNCGAVCWRHGQLYQWNTRDHLEYLMSCAIGI